MESKENHKQYGKVKSISE